MLKFRDSLSYIYVDKGVINQDGLSISVHDDDGRTQIPVSNLALLMLGPGTSITHAAVCRISDSGCLVAWVGERGVRFYAHGGGETRSAAWLLRQASLASNPASQIEVAKAMYRMRFQTKPGPSIGLKGLRGMEGVRVRSIYAAMSQKFGIAWKGRSYNRHSWDSSDPLNKALSAANACLYGVCHSAIVTLGLSPGLGFVHVGKMLSFVYDIADLYKADYTIPAAFEAASIGGDNIERATRMKMRDIFKERKLLSVIVSDIECPRSNAA